MKRVVTILALLCCCSSVTLADAPTFESEGALESAVMKAVDNRQNDVELLCKVSDSQAQLDPADKALGLYGQRLFGQNTILKGVDSLQKSTTTQNGVIHYKYKIKYNYTKAEEAALQKSIKAWVDSNLTSDMSEMVKAALITKYIADNYLFTTTREYDNAVAAFKYKFANPTGFAELASRMYTAANIQNEILTGISTGPTLRWYSGDPVSLQSLALARTPAETVSTPDLQAWNLVKVNGNWYHVNICRYNMFPKSINHKNDDELFASDALCALSEGWIKEEYPSADKVLWEENSPEQQFVKAMFGSILFDYPIAHTSADFQGIVDDALRNGKSHVEVRYISEPGSPGECTPLYSSHGTVGLVYIEHMKSTLWQAGFYHVELFPRTAEPVYPIARISSLISVERGDQLDQATILGNSSSGLPAPSILVLSPDRVLVNDGKYQAVSSGDAYIAIVSGGQEKIVKLKVMDPKLGILLNGKLLASAAPITRNERTLVPLKSLFEAMGATVNYDSATRSVTALKGNTSIQFTLGKRVATVNGKQIQMGTPADIIDGHCYVPARFVGESLGAVVDWNPLKNKVVITMMDSVSTNIEKTTPAH